MMMMMMMINWYPKLAYQLSIDMCSETWLLSAQLEGDGKKSYVGSKHFPGAVLTLLNSQARSWENKGWFLRRTGLSQSTSIHTTACPALKREYDDEDTRRRSPRVKGARPAKEYPRGSPSRWQRPTCSSQAAADPRPHTGDSSAASQLRLELIIVPTDYLLMYTVVNNKLIII